MNYDLWSEVTDVFCCEFFCWRMIRPTRRSFKSSLGRITLPAKSHVRKLAPSTSATWKTREST
jgi:hypothetical protein